MFESADPTPGYIENPHMMLFPAPPTNHTHFDEYYYYPSVFGDLPPQILCATQRACEEACATEPACAGFDWTPIGIGGM